MIKVAQTCVISNYFGHHLKDLLLTILCTYDNNFSRSNINNNNAILMVSLSDIGLFSLCKLATMAAAESSSTSTPGNSNRTGNDTTVKQMGICQTGVKSPYNDNSVQ